MDILKYASDVEILEPEALRDEIKILITAALKNYKK